jgi:tetratricopeptide (TPR) repeat protein
MSSELDYSKLEDLVRAEDYQQAEVFCRATLAAGLAPLFWETQLGYIYFLNEKDDRAWYEQALPTFESLVAKNPANANARFWLAYVYWIVWDDIENSIQELRKVLALNPNHAYANLVLAGQPDYKQSVELLRKVLKQQPNNFRVLRQLANVLLASKQKAQVKELLERILTNEAYVEQQYGIMNEYINDVLTQATQQQELREEAKAQLQQLSRN